MGVQTAQSFDDELARFDAVGTAEALASGALSPVEVAEAAARRAEKVEPEIRAIVTHDHDRAVAAARRLTRRGGLAGVPTYIKDQIDVAGMPTTFGSEAIAGGPTKSKHSGLAVQFAEMGMVLLGKSTMPEFGFAPATEPVHVEATHNPWNLERTVGGSSGGAAALVAAGVVPVAHAVDGGGSIRIPAACCGLVGLKPTRWRMLPHREEQILPLAVSVDGIVSRTVRDTARFMALAEQQWRNRRLIPMGEVTRPLQRRLRIAAFIDLPIDAPVDEATRRTFEDTIALLESLGHQVEPTEIPVDALQFRDDFITYWQCLSFLATRTAKVTHGRHVRSERFIDFTQGLANEFKRAPQQVVGAARRLRATSATMAEFHQRYDVALSPVTSTIAPPLGHMHNSLPYAELLDRVARWIPYTPLANAAGTPAISLPLGFEDGTNLPVAMMFSAAHGADALLLELALELEAARPFPTLAGS